MRTASIVCGLLAIGLLAYTGYRYVVDEYPPGEAITVHEPDRDLSSQPCETVSVCFRITNGSLQPIRVVGLAPG